MPVIFVKIKFNIIYLNKDIKCFYFKNFSSLIFLKLILGLPTFVEGTRYLENLIARKLSAARLNSLFSDYEAVGTNNSTKLGTVTTKKFYSTSCISIHPQFITGVSDAEASFFIIFVKSNKYSLGYSVQLSYQITLHKRDKVLLELIKSYFGVGSIHMKNTREVMVYQVTSIKDLTAIVSHFNKFPLNTNKRADYELFQMGFK
jgi:hypothetical protein